MYNYLVKFFRNVTMSFFTAICVIALAGVTCRDGIMTVSYTHLDVYKRQQILYSNEIFILT